jgi:hypothetical protein
VGVTHATAVDDVGHLHPRAKLVGLDLYGEDGNLRRFHVFENGSGHVVERTRRQIFKDEGIEWAAALCELGRDGCGNRLGDAVGDERDLFVGLNAKAGEDGGASAGDEFRWVTLRKQVRGGGCKACDDCAPSVGMDAMARIYSG